MAILAVAFLVVFLSAALIVARSGWRFFRSGEQPERAGSFGRQFFGRSDHATKPEDWLKH
jgi:hypothetical protein